MNLKKLKDKIEKLQTFDTRLFIGQSYFFNDGAQLLLNISNALLYFKKIR